MNQQYKKNPFCQLSRPPNPGQPPFSFALEGSDASEGFDASEGILGASGRHPSEVYQDGGPSDFASELADVSCCAPDSSSVCLSGTAEFVPAGKYCCKIESASKFDGKKRPKIHTWKFDVDGLYFFSRLSSVKPLCKTSNFSVVWALSAAALSFSPAMRWGSASVRSQMASVERRLGSLWIKHYSTARVLTSSTRFFNATWL